MRVSPESSRTVRRLASEAQLLALALTGEILPVTQSCPQALVGELADLGWTSDALVELRRDRQQLHQPWPFPVPLSERREVGCARFDAQVAQLRSLLGLDGLRTTLAPMGVRPGPRERHLIEERPPHWG